MKILKECFNSDPALFLGLAEGTDARELYLCEVECFPSDPWSEASFSENLKNDACTMLCIYNMQLQKIVAYSVVFVAGDEGDLANIAVLPRCRGEGLGGALLDEILKKAFSDGASQMFLEVRESNSPAIGLYRSRSFTEIGKRKRYYKNPTEDAVLMMREQ